MNIDENAKQYIIELETINDLQRAEIEEKDELIRSLKAQLQAIKNGQGIDYGVA